MAGNFQGRTSLVRTRRMVIAATAVLAVAITVFVATSGAASSSQASSTRAAAANADSKALAATIKKAFFASIPASKLQPVVRNTLAVASRPLTPAQNRLLQTCLKNRSCDTGRGTLTVAINRDNVNAWVSVYRAEATAQAIASPQVKRIIYTSTNGTIAGVLANLRSLVAQRVDIIVEDSIFGAAIVPVVKQATRAGIAFVNVNSPLPPAAEAAMTVHIPFDLCAFGRNAATAVVSRVKPASAYAFFSGIPGNVHASTWQPCARRVLDGAGWTQAQAPGWTNWTPQGDSQAANALLASGKDVGALFYDAGLDEFLKPFIAANEKPPAGSSDALFFSFFKVFQDARGANLSPLVFVSNARSWFGRLGVTAGVMVKTGQRVPKRVLPPNPVVPFASILSWNKPGIPAQAPIPVLLTPAQVRLALSVS